ncbi:hypothetical protein RGQ29_000401 [Quercus rubra]|uniref:HP domain-containing protein n=1 Tax=Quercus rubra TaxID=3512 RepID=A0AAN7GAZ6_QUERU|nr:hypothetical protein RGQ29_000401 [Quercus rubra]
MSLHRKDTDSAFEGAGSKAGLEIWCIENLRLVPVPKSSHGKFYTGNAYIVLKTVLPKTGPAQHEIHYWLGNDTNKVDSAFASDKALELDAALGSCTVQYRELQGLETGKFLSYFKPCIIPVEGLYSSHQGHLNGETYKFSLLTCKGDHVVHIKEVPFSRSSLNHNDVFILDTASKIFLFSGCNSSIQERAKALEVVQYIKENNHGGKCEVATIEDGKFVGDSDVGEFWSLFGGFAPIPRDSPSSVQKQSDAPSVKLFWITTQGKLCQTGTDSLNKKILETDKCYMLDCGAEIFVWMGRQTLISERKTSISATEVWRVNGDELSLLPVPEQTKFYSGDCYVVQFTYPGNERDENLFYAWIGRRSVMEDRRDAISHMNAIVDSTKGDPVLAQAVEDKEPVQFFLIFQTLIIFKGGMSKRYKKFIAEKGITDETYDGIKTALFRVQGTSPQNMQAIEVDLVSSSLNSSYCYILQTETFIFTWIGSLSSTRDHDLLDRMLELINPTLQPISVREGSEPDIFWNALGGKAEYPKAKEMKQCVEDPHLFTLNTTEGDFKVKEIYNFSQDDLTTEDVLVLDCHREIYVWIGCHSSVGSKQEALTLGLKFLEMDVLVEGLSLETPIYIVTEGHEPPFFTRFFEWDPSKANMHGNSFERKLAILKGKPHNLEVPTRNSWKAYSRETTPDGLRSKSVISNGLGRSGSPASSVSGSNSKSSTNQLFSSPTPIVRKLFSGSPHDESLVSAGSPAAEPRSLSQSAGFIQADGSGDCVNLLIYPYERLSVISSDPVAGIDVTKREAYLSDEDFQDKFGMTKRAFYELPKWRQNKLKMSLHLF